MRTWLYVWCMALPLVAQTGEIRLEPVVTGLTNPVDIQSARDGSGRLFIAQQSGLIRVWRNGQLSPFLDLTSKTMRSGECGLLGLAFPPGFATKRHFYVNYTDRQCRNSIVARYRLATDQTADGASEQVVLQVAQPFTNHNGGQLRFGTDGFLYLGFGDGGSGGDPQDNGQNRRSLLGKILRLDVESGDATYRVPGNNPWVSDGSGLPEIWAYGLRNPWRFSFDRETGDLWIADVGQDRAEEINVQPVGSRGGENYGWRVMEGFRCRTAGCNSTGSVLPVHEYTRSQRDLSVTGGFVYRGPNGGKLTGTYLYGDYVSGRIWGIDRGGQNRLLLESGLSLSTFGEDEDGTIYVADYGGGRVLRVVPMAREQLVLSVVNGATFLPGLAAGGIGTVFTRGVVPDEGVVAASTVPLPRSLAGVQVTVNGREAPLYAVAKVNRSEQVNFQVPWETATGAAIVRVNGVELARVEVGAAVPAVFLANGVGVVVHHADNTLVTNERPLVAGESAYLYATGLGAVENQPVTGEAASTTQLSRVRSVPTVTLAGRSCEVQFAGLAPGLVGVYQINIRVPEGITSGLPHLTVTQGGQASRPVPVALR